MKPALILAGFAACAYGAVCAAVFLFQADLLYHPTHRVEPSPLAPWTENGEIVGYCRKAGNPRMVWLMTHGNSGQANERAYVLGRMRAEDSLFVLEYPGFGSRAGIPSMASFNRAAEEAFGALRREYPGKPIGVLGESIGSGPACHLASMPEPPDRVVLVVPFDTLVSVASEHVPLLPVSLLLRDSWDNARALARYPGPIEIYGAREDTVIPISHARNLARGLREATFVEIAGGHNDWSESELVRIGG